MASETQKIITILERGTQRVLRDLGASIHQRLSEETPRDTNFARTNWIPSIGKESEQIVGSKADVDFGQIGRGQSIIHGWVLEMGSLYIANNVPYIRRLNGGSSVQAPAGFVEGIVQQEVNSFGRVNIE